MRCFSFLFLSFFFCHTTIVRLRASKASRTHIYFDQVAIYTRAVRLWTCIAYTRPGTGKREKRNTGQAEVKDDETTYSRKVITMTLYRTH